MPKEREMNTDALHYKTCPICKKKALVKTCTVCHGTGQVTITSPGQWSPSEVRRNPFLPYMASPPPVVRQVKCSACNGRGWFLSCLHCRGVPIQKRLRSPIIPRQKLSTASKSTSTGHCPKCGFSYMWNGLSCGHCGYSR
jgi:DnaJ-class molecular chaperone